MKSFIIALVACVGLSGCYQQTSNFDLHRAVTFCGAVENIAEISVYAIGNGDVRYMDQRYSLLSKVKMESK